MNDAPLSLIPNQRHRFDIPDDVAYFNCAYMGPLMHAVVAAGDLGVRAKARPWTIATSDFFEGNERARHLFAAIVGADSEGRGHCAVGELRPVLRGSQSCRQRREQDCGAGGAVSIQRLCVAGTGK